MAQVEFQFKSHFRTHNNGVMPHGSLPGEWSFNTGFTVTQYDETYMLSVFLIIIQYAFMQDHHNNSSVISPHQLYCDHGTCSILGHIRNSDKNELTSSTDAKHPPEGANQGTGLNK